MPHTWDDARAVGLRPPDGSLGLPLPSLQIPLAAEWQEVLQLAGVAAHAAFRPVAYIENAATNSQAYVYWNGRERAACVAFRGTEQGKWKVGGRAKGWGGS